MYLPSSGFSMALKYFSGTSLPSYHQRRHIAKWNDVHTDVIHVCYGESVILAPGKSDATKNKEVRCSKIFNDFSCTLSCRQSALYTTLRPPHQETRAHLSCGCPLPLPGLPSRALLPSLVRWHHPDGVLGATPLQYRLGLGLEHPSPQELL